MTEAETTKRKCTIRKGVVVDAHVEATFPHVDRWYGRTVEEYGTALERACKEFEEFLRDHRSQDVVRLSVERECKDICSVCEAEWDQDDDENGPCCANCGATLKET